MDLLFIKENAGQIPYGKTVSSARKSRAWFDKVNDGDILTARVTEDGTAFAQVVVVAKELHKLDVVLDNADHNMTAVDRGLRGHAAADALADALRAAYGPLLLDDEYTVLHLLRLSGRS